RVNTEIDTAKDAWSIASGNYASRFAAAVAGTAKLAAERIAARLARVAASQFNTDADDIVFENGTVHSRRNPDNKIAFSRLAGLSHWSPGTLPDDIQQTIRETVFWTPPELTAPDEEDRVNSSLCYGFIFDFCGVEIDRTTLMTRIDRYVTMHDCGTILHPGMVDGQIRGGFAQALGAALYEEYAYAADGSFLTGTFADYLLPTTVEVPDPVILHMETPSPFTPLGSKGVGEGNCMSTPVCIANAVADALGMKDVELPLVPAKLADIVRGAEPAPPAGRRAGMPRTPKGDRQLRGEGSATVAASSEAVWAMLLDPATLQAVIPGCHGVEKISDTHFRADVTIGVGPVKGRYRAEVTLSDLDAPRAVTLGGSAEGALGFGNGEGRITLTPENAGTVVRYEYDAAIGGKVASIGGRLLDGAARVIIGQFFSALARQAGGASAQDRPSLMGKLRALFGRRS
ncbi:MAG TPA: molybdopterin cofactor-binding domain-containing protein, partial [Paraburkholderia sp.]|nr:molybdopterin cofactor-binding domain-containing protein [Paraburkholderia sp.]